MIVIRAHRSHLALTAITLAIVLFSARNAQADSTGVIAYGWDGQRFMPWRARANVGLYHPSGVFVLGDFDGDNAADLMQAYPSGARLGLALVRSMGTAQIQTWDSGDMGQGPSALAWLVGDITGDGRAELLQPWSNSGTRLGMLIYGWDGIGMTGLWGTDYISTIPGALAWLVGDINGDGRAEIIQPWKNSARLGMNVYGWTGAEMRSLFVSSDMSQGPSALAWLVGDINGDGREEVIQPWNNNNRLGMVVYGWDGYKMKILRKTLDVGQGPWALGWLIGDVNGDRKAEVIQLWQNGDRLGMLVYGWNGAGMVGLWGSEDMGHGPWSLTWLAGDVTGDGRVDVVQPWQNGDQLGMIVYAWDGAGMSALWGSTDVGQGPGALAWLIADANGDGKSDVVQPWNAGRLGEVYGIVRYRTTGDPAVGVKIDVVEGRIYYSHDGTPIKPPSLRQGFTDTVGRYRINYTWRSTENPTLYVWAELPGGLVAYPRNSDIDNAFQIPWNAKKDHVVETPLQYDLLIPTAEEISRGAR